MSGLQCLASENVWFDKHRFDEAEKRFYEGANGPAPQQQQVEKTIGNFHKITNKPIHLFPCPFPSLAGVGVAGGLLNATL